MLFWEPGEAVTAGCQLFGDDSTSFIHAAPREYCSCGIYTAKSAGIVFGYAPILGEMYGWGSTIEHQYGWRVQYAYPKMFYIAEGQPVERLQPLRGADHDASRAGAWTIAVEAGWRCSFGGNRAVVDAFDQPWLASAAQSTSSWRGE